MSWRQCSAGARYRVSRRMIVDLATLRGAHVTRCCRHLATSKLSCQISHLSADLNDITHLGVCRTQHIMTRRPAAWGSVRLKATVNQYVTYSGTCVASVLHPYGCIACAVFDARCTVSKCARVERKGKPTERWDAKPLCETRGFVGARGAHVESQFQLLVCSGRNSNVGSRISRRL